MPWLQIKAMSILTKRRALEEKIIIESHNDFDCNGGAFYEYLLSKGINRRVKIVWLLYHPLKERLPNNVAWAPLYGPSLKKAWHVCTAKWLTADCTITEKVREDQLSIYMTHGIFGLKNAKGLVHIPATVDYVLSPSPQADHVLRDEYVMDLAKTRFAHLGFPVLDRLYAARHSKGYRPLSHSAKTVFLWMPTFRKGVAYGRDDADGSYVFGIPLINDRRELDEFASFVRSCEALVVIKLHPKQDLTSISSDVPKGIVFLTADELKKSAFDTYDLMLESSALITDYSGAATEYLALNKPISYVLADLHNYKLGLIDNAEQYMPGEKVFTLDELKSFMVDVCSGRDSYAELRADFRSRFFSWNDARSSERVSHCLGIE